MLPVERKYFSMDTFIEGFWQLHESVLLVLLGWDLISNDTMLSVVAAAYEELLYEVNSWLYCYLIGRKRFLIES